MYLKIKLRRRPVTTEFTRELLFLEVNHSHVASRMSSGGRDFVTAETEPLVAGESLYGTVDVPRVYSDQLQARTESWGGFEP